LSFCARGVLVSCFARRVMMAPFLPFYSLVASYAAICSGCFSFALCDASFGAAWCGGRGVWRWVPARRASWSRLHLAACAWLLIECCVLVFLCFRGVCLSLCLSRHDGALPSVPSLSAF
jgi:hypothetical protein